MGEGVERNVYTRLSLHWIKNATLDFGAVKSMQRILGLSSADFLQGMLMINGNHLLQFLM
jgi:hypothetical protein